MNDYSIFNLDGSVKVISSPYGSRIVNGVLTDITKEQAGYWITDYAGERVLVKGTDQIRKEAIESHLSHSVKIKAERVRKEQRAREVLQEVEHDFFLKHSNRILQEK